MLPPAIYFLVRFLPFRLLSLCAIVARMHRSSHRSRFLVLLLFAILPSQVLAQTCNTNQNPTCSGNSKFEALCCPAPNVCYWQNRYEVAGCCPAGQVCGEGNNDGGETEPTTTNGGGLATTTVTGAWTTTAQGGLITETATQGQGGVVTLVADASTAMDITFMTFWLMPFQLLLACIMT